jgi:hypothetical protein
MWQYPNCVVSVVDVPEWCVECSVVIVSRRFRFL